MSASAVTEVAIMFLLQVLRFQPQAVAVIFGNIHVVKWTLGLALCGFRNAL
jgi:hypothetical protein